MTNTPPDQDNASLDAQLNEAVEHHRAGRLFEAEEIYRRILAVDPDHPFALCLLGTWLGFLLGQSLRKTG